MGKCVWLRHRSTNSDHGHLEKEKTADGASDQSFTSSEKIPEKRVPQKYLSQKPTVPFVFAQRHFGTPSNFITRLYTSTFWNGSIT
jgi:hypothetical protein